MTGENQQTIIKKVKQQVGQLIFLPYSLLRIQLDYKKWTFTRINQKSDIFPNVFFLVVSLLLTYFVVVLFGFYLTPTGILQSFDFILVWLTSPLTILSGTNANEQLFLGTLPYGILLFYMLSNGYLIYFFYKTINSKPLVKELSDYKMQIHLFHQKLKFQPYDFLLLILSLYPIIFYLNPALFFTTQDIFFYIYFVWPGLVFLILFIKYLCLITVRFDFKRHILVKLETEDFEGNYVDYFLFGDFLDRKLNVYQFQFRHFLLLIALISPILDLYL